VAPGGDAQFNVAIRTALVDELAGRLSFGVGSGIVWDSDADEEYRECLLKGLVLERRHESFELLETLAWSPGSGFVLLDEHLDRLSRSAAYFGVPVRQARVRRALDDAVADARDAQRVRLLVEPGGHPRVETSALAVSAPTVRACLALEPIDPSDRFYYHKTTRRAEYDRRRCRHCEDVILWNRNGEITESTVANVVVDLRGTLVTPPVYSGLLAGTARAALLRERRIVESVVTAADLLDARAVWLVNSVRGWRRVERVEH
jgi:para-aminobenzoate synthetase/4-amino-4-deoxychorismate lyase